MSGTSGPLDGIKVLELGTMYAAPTGGRMMRDFGADVIKVEDPATGPKISCRTALASAGRLPSRTGLTNHPFCGSGLVTWSSLRPPAASESSMKPRTRAW